MSSSWHIIELWVAAASASLPMGFCHYHEAIGKPFGLAAATRAFAFNA